MIGINTHLDQQELRCLLPKAAGHGIHDAVSLQVQNERLAPSTPVTQLGMALIEAFSYSAEAQGLDMDIFRTGGFYYRVLNPTEHDARMDQGGTFHYDARGQLLSEYERSAHRMVMTLTTDGVDIGNLFSDRPEYEGRLSSEVLSLPSHDLLQMPNGWVVHFDEVRDLHARPPQVADREGAVSIFASAVLRAHNSQLVACAALQ